MFESQEMVSNGSVPRKQRIPTLFDLSQNTVVLRRMASLMISMEKFSASEDVHPAPASSLRRLSSFEYAQVEAMAHTYAARSLYSLVLTCSPSICARSGKAFS